MNRLARRILMTALTAAATMAFSQAGNAAEPRRSTAEAHYQKGMKSYTLGRFEDAIEEFEKAYELRQEPIFLYNIAQSHRQNNNPQRAIFFYRRYLEADPNAKNRAETEKRISDMESDLNQKAESAAATVPTAPPSAPPPATPPAAAPLSPQVTQPVLPVQAQAAAPASTGRGLRIAGITVGALGVAGVVTGVFFGVHANSLHDEATSGTYDDSKYQDSETFRTLQWVSVGVGAAAIVTGGVLYYLGYAAEPAGPQVAIVPIAGPGAGGAALCGRF
jgi:tetratricopeptide (TPR) repeat protein